MGRNKCRAGDGRESGHDGRGSCKTSPGNSNSLCTVLINQSRGAGEGRDEDSGWHSIKAIKSFFSSTTHDVDDDDDDNPAGNGYGG